MQSYILKDTFPNVKMSESLGKLKIINIVADSKKRTVSAEMKSDVILDYAEVEEFVEEMKEEIRTLFKQYNC